MYITTSFDIRHCCEAKEHELRHSIGQIRTSYYPTFDAPVAHILSSEGRESFFISMRLHSQWLAREPTY